jgi:hypothetical protein
MKTVFTKQRVMAVLILALSSLMQKSFAQAPTNLFVWNFEDQNLTVDVDNAAGIPTMLENGPFTSAQYFTGMDGACATTTTGTFARSVAAWDAGDNYQFTVETTGFTDMTFSVCLRTSTAASTTTFRVRASTDGTTWTTIVNDFTFGAGTGSAIKGVSGVLPVAFNNQPVVYIQVYCPTTLAAATTAIRIDNVTLTSAPPPPVLYYRSVATGSYSANATWESSTDNATWAAATRSPTSSDNTVTIQAGHTVTIDAAITLDQVVIKSGATLAHASNAGIVTVNDGTGDDVIIENGGVYLVNGQSDPLLPTPAQTYAQRITMGGSSAFRVETGGIIRIGNGVTSYVGTGFAGFPTNLNSTWQDGAIYEWNNQSNLPFQGDFFPNAAPGIIPILKTTVAIPGSGGSGTTAFTLKGLLQANAIVHVGGATTKFFRDGINNADSLVFGTTVGKITIGNGTTTKLEGAGVVKMPDAGMDIAANSLITLNANKTIVLSSTFPRSATSILTLLSGSRITLGSNNLNLIGRAATTGGYIVTSGTGSLMQDSIGTVAVLFPVGPTALLYHPVTITNIGTIDSFAVKVGSATPACDNPAYAVNATWDITEAIAGGSDCTLAIDFAGATTGGSFSAATGSIDHCSGITADYSNGTITGTVATGSGFTNFSPFGISTPVALPLRLVSFNATNSNGVVNLKWVTTNEVNLNKFIVEESNDGSIFNAVGSVNANNLPITNTYNFNKTITTTGNLYYRIKIVNSNGTAEYSTIVLVKANNKTIAIYPNPVKGTLNLSGIKLNTTLSIINANGQVVKQIVADANTLSIDVSGLATGVYSIKVKALNEDPYNKTFIKK